MERLRRDSRPPAASDALLGIRSPFSLRTPDELEQSKSGASPTATGERHCSELGANAVACPTNGVAILQQIPNVAIARTLGRLRRVI